MSGNSNSSWSGTVLAIDFLLVRMFCFGGLWWVMMVELSFGVLFWTDPKQHRKREALGFGYCKPLVLVLAMAMESLNDENGSLNDENGESPLLFKAPHTLHGSVYILHPRLWPSLCVSSLQLLGNLSSFHIYYTLNLRTYSFSIFLIQTKSQNVK